MFDRDTAPPGMGIFLAKLLSHSLLSTEDQAAIAALPHQTRHLEPNDYILREGDPSDICPVLRSGFAYRQKITASGGREIVSIKIPGDPLDFQSMYLRTVDHNLQALTAVELTVIMISDFERLVQARPAIARAVMVDILIEASIGREWLLNNGRRNALARLAHLFCELHFRLHDTGSGGLDIRKMPLTQEQLADVLGLTPVHVNRTLKALERSGGIARDGRGIRIADLKSLIATAEFSDLYLHRDQS
ncbi:Crp/Fnr family transcriptional regulator [Sphingopyxis sp. JAI128]|uniref:Crp/Fnr family transcriptional regulator n=1 Tax=Sphingopyxis sp. JAI128 TaxID=2723066 RepID=UPI001613A8C1|nr:Crp/Fnr family transcriptional regulator [Sphingopyxis sp. JAI128]MBB6427794.1 CRP-like cAMP-binding protein [Sphingopyxis sp. JAI128]